MRKIVLVLSLMLFSLISFGNNSTDFNSIDAQSAKYNVVVTSSNQSSNEIIQIIVVRNSDGSIAYVILLFSDGSTTVIE